MSLYTFPGLEIIFWKFVKEFVQESFTKFSRDIFRNWTLLEEYLQKILQKIAPNILAWLFLLVPAGILPIYVISKYFLRNFFTNSSKSSSNTSFTNSFWNFRHFSKDFLLFMNRGLSFFLIFLQEILQKIIQDFYGGISPINLLKMSLETLQDTPLRYFLEIFPRNFLRDCFQNVSRDSFRDSSEYSFANLSVNSFVREFLQISFKKFFSEVLQGFLLQIPAAISQDFFFKACSKK